MNSNQTPPSERATVRGRTAQNAVYDRAAIDAILDEGMVCHVGFVEDGEPFVIPMSYARVGGALYVHGSRAGRTMRVLASGDPICLEVTIVDGLVLGPIPTFHGVNYRSVVLFGSGREVTDPEERLAALKAILDHTIPGRWADLRQPTPDEVAAAAVAAIPIDEASAKVRSGPPVEDDAEASQGVWTGVLPLRLSALDPIPAPTLGPDIPVPEYVQHYRRGSSGSKADSA